MFRDVPVTELATTVIRAHPGPHRRPARPGRRRPARPGLRQRRGAGAGPRRGARCRAARRRPRPADRPALRVRAAGGHRGGHAGPDRRRRCRARRRRREHEPGRAVLDHAALGRALGRRDAGGPAGARPRDRGRRELPGARRHDRDRREPAPRVRHPARRSRTSWRCAPTSAPSPPRRAARSPEEIVPVEVRERKTGTRLIDRDEHPRADATLESLASLRPVMAPQGPGGDRHRRQRLAARTTAPRSASSPTPRRRPSSA